MNCMLEKSQIRYICWMVTSACNMKCPICYAYLGEEAPDIKTKKKIIDKIHKLGIHRITFTGGEPLLGDNLFDIIKYAKSKGLYTGLTTNGLLLTKHDIEELDFILDELTLPLDGSNVLIHGLHRSPNNDQHFHIINRLLNMVSNHNFKTAVSTVMTKLNKDDFPNIIKIINTNRIKRWKIFRYYPQGRFACNSEYFQLSDEDFFNVKYKILSFPSSIDIIFRNSNESVMQSYINISPTGKILFSKSNRYENIGNILKINDIYSILKKENFNFTEHNKRRFRDQL